MRSKYDIEYQLLKLPRVTDFDAKVVISSLAFWDLCVLTHLTLMWYNLPKEPDMLVTACMISFVCVSCTAVGDQCLPGWDMNLSKCYYFDKTAYKSWDDSRSECISYGGDLVVIKEVEVEVRSLSSLIKLLIALFFQVWTCDGALRHWDLIPSISSRSWHICEISRILKPGLLFKTWSFTSTHTKEVWEIFQMWMCDGHLQNISRPWFGCYSLGYFTET